ncbi:MAG: adenylate kinase [Nitrosopumilaceae archaeon]|nr:adenylate kinase [Nitrosopumilaceae archaeon]
MHCLAEHKKIIIVGIPGVGKSAVVTKVEEILKEKNKTVSVKSFGTIMLEQASKNGIHDRDELRKASVETQHKLQILAAKAIGEIKDEVVIIDTHAFISTTEGFYPGLPKHVLEQIKPTNFIVVSARSEEIYNRRMKDKTRNRDIISIDTIKKELAVQDAMLSSCSVLTGAPMKLVLNSEGKIEETAKSVIHAIGL